MNRNVGSEVSGGATYDLVIKDGRVMDPLTRVDVVANVGIKDGRIAAIVPVDQGLSGDKLIDATGLVVAPGFINIHGHGSGNGPGGEFHVRDGITTEITGNCGYSGGWSGRTDPTTEARQHAYPLAKWFTMLEQQGLLINVASYTGHRTLREVVGISDPFAAATDEDVTKMVSLVAPEMEAGAIGISFGPFYAPGSRYQEMLALAKEASRLGGCAASHVRAPPPMPPADMESITEAINMAREANIPFIISHMGSPHVAPKSTGTALEFIFEARDQGLRIATDCHPHDAFQTSLAAAIFEAPREDYSEIEVATTVVIDGRVVMEAGATFSNSEQFHFVRGKVKAGEIPDPGVIGHIYPPHKTMLWLSSPITMVENDGAIRVDPATKKYAGHPRGAGSFAKFLGYWVRERGVCDLMTALSKTSTMAAVWLGLNNKGRIQVGCDADLTLFDADKVIDRATYADPGQPSSGIPYVIVNGLIAVDNGKLTGEKAGRAIRRKWNIPGVLPKLGRLPKVGIENLTG